VTISADGTSVYVAGATDHAVSIFKRDPNGALTPTGCVADNDTGEDLCGKTANGLAVVVAIAVSRDGTSAYTVSGVDDAVVRFKRGSSGALTFVDCVDDPEGGDDNCGTTAAGLGQPQELVVTRDGASVYVVSFGDDAIVRFARDPETGKLTPAGCIQDVGAAAGCAKSTNGLAGVIDVDASRDGRSVYVAAASDHAITRFDRAISGDELGKIAPRGCIDDNDVVSDPCAQSTNGLQAANGVTVSKDGTSVYTVALIDDAVVRFSRAP
jgi:DNA-binding beta-propeller fold protein YncE